MNERIRSAALRYEDGHIEEGICHALAHLAAQVAGHGKWLAEGFVTTEGRFLSRREAALLISGQDYWLCSEEIFPAAREAYDA